MKLFLLVLLSAFTIEGFQNGKIIGGHTVDISAYPFVVSLNYYGTHICGGSIISNRYILTAAHCVYDLKMSKLAIHAGSKLFTKPRQRSSINRFKIHEKYNANTSDNDIAIIELKTTLQFKRRVLPISLPISNAEVPPNSTALILGWGSTKEDGDKTLTLRKVFIPVIDRGICKKLYFPYLVSDNMLCAGLINGGKDSCQGDSGGPMVIGGRLLGIISWGYGCARPGFPGVYTDVSKYRSWIRVNAGV